MILALWLLPFLTPMILAGIIALTRPPDRVVGWLLGLAAFPAFLLALQGSLAAEVDFARFFLGAHFEMDATRRLFLLFSSLLYGLAGWFTGSYQAHDENRIRFDVFFLLSMAGNLGLIMAGDIVTFYAFFVLMTFSAFGVVVHTWTPGAQRAGHIYLILAVVGEVFLLAAIFLAAHAAGSILVSDLGPAVAQADNRDLIVGLALMGFGVKVGAIPLYFWLPLAHPVAPTPASAVLSAAMLKAGLLGWLHLLPLGEVSLPGWGGLAIGAGLTAALGGALVGLTQTHPKAALAYSSISQMGLLTVYLGLGLKAGADWPALAPGLAFFALHHGLAKGALFLGTGVIAVARQGGRWILAGMLLPGLVLAGAPATTGALAKESLKQAATSAPSGWVTLLTYGLPLSTLLTTLLVGRILWTSRQVMGQHPHGTLKGLLPAWLVLLVLLALAPWWANLALAQPLPWPGLKATLLALLPLLGGVVLAALTLSRGWLKSWSGCIPPGDLLVPLERMVETARHRIQASLAGLWKRDFLNLMHWADRIIALEMGRSVVDIVERRLGTWAMIGLLFLSTLLLLLWSLR